MSLFYGVACVVAEATPFFISDSHVEGTFMVRLALVATLVAGALGCDDGIIPIETAPVSGMATFNGKPLEDYRVFFYSEQDAAKEPASGLIDAEGRFSLSVRTENDGAIIGPNKIWFVFDPFMPPQEPGHEVPVKLPPPKVKIPDKYLKRETSGLSVEVPSEGLTDYKLDLKDGE